MDYLALIKKAYQITLKNRFLWIFGLFVGSAAAFGGFGGFPNSGGGTKTPNPAAPSRHEITVWLDRHIMLLLWLALIFILLIIVMFVFALLSEGALIGGANKIIKEEKVGFSSALKLGCKHFWRIWGLNIIYGLLVMAALFILGVPVMVFVSISNWVLAICWGIIGLLILWLLAMAISLTRPYALRFLVLENKTINNSIRESIHLVRDKFVEVLLVYLSLVATSFLYGIVLAIAIFIIGGLLVLLGVGLYFASKVALILYIALVGLAFLIFLITLGAAYNAFQSVALTLAYKELRDK